MSDERWQQVWSLFHQVIEKPPEERDRFLREACAGDGSLLEEVGSLIPFHAKSGDVLESPALLDPLLGDGDWTAPLAGDRLGPYRILQEIGEGGMGVVYEAEQEAPIRRRVALKLIKLGMDTREVLTRFLAEQQTLALMNHPGIASVYDAGMTDQGRPYFVMERVEGIPITEYCDAERSTIRERLELFMAVCHAVQHAHQKGIIHRDIKPSNVLVTLVNGKPVPKIIDFGVAKALEEPVLDENQRTLPGRIVGTLEFMSPEQAAMAVDIDTRSDIYSLGVLLYRILTGLLPYPAATSQRDYEALRRDIIDLQIPAPSSRFRNAQDPETIAAARRTDPSALCRHLQRELDWIALKALEKERGRRYPSVAQFAEDIGAFLSHQPVTAAPPAAVYRMRKFIRRHRLGVALSAASALVLLATAVALAVQSGQIRRALVEAKNSQEEAEQVSNFLVDLFRRSNPFTNKNVTVREVLDEGAAKLTRDLSGRTELQASLMETMGVAYRNLALFDRAVPLIEQSLELRKQLGLDVEIASSLYNLGVSYQYQGKMKEAEPRLRESLSMRRKLLGEHTAVVKSLVSLGSVLRETGDLANAKQTLQEALALQRRLSPPDEVQEAVVLENLASVLYRHGEYPEAEKTYETSLVLRRRRPDSQMGTAGTLNSFGAFLIDRGKYDAAEPLLREALEWYRKNLGDRHPLTIPVMNNLALLFQQKGDFNSAESFYRQIIALTSPDNLTQSAINHNNLALVLQDKGSYAEAEEAIRQALTLQRRAWGERHSNVGFGLNNLARVLQDQGRWAAAEKHYREALELRRATLPARHPNLAASLAGLGNLLTERGRPAKAEPLLREALDIRRQAFSAGDWRTAESESFLGECLAAQGRYGEAEPYLVQGYGALKAKRGQQNRSTRQALQRLIHFYEISNRPDKAAEYRRLVASAPAGGVPEPAVKR